MSDLLKSLDEKRKSALAQAREIAERAAAGEERAEDEEAYKRANADFDRYTAQMRDEAKRASEDAEIAEAMEAAFRKAGVRELGNEKQEERKNESQWLADVRSAISEQRTAKGGGSQTLPDMRRLREVRALMAPETRATIDTTVAAETIPTTLVESLFRKLFDDSTIMSAGVHILRTASGEALKFPRLASLGALAQASSRVAEKGQIQKSEPTFDSVTLNAFKYGQISQSDREAIQDSVIDIEGLLGEVLGRNMANYLGYDLTLGTGTGQPRGVVTVASSGSNVVTSGTGVTGKIASADELLDIIWKLKPAYRRNGKFLMNDATVLNLRKFKINNEANNYAFQPGDASGKPDTLMGYPLLTDPNIAAQALNAVSIVFGDMSLYYVRMVADVRVEWSTEYAWDTDLVSVKAVLRADGDAIDDTAFAAFKGAAT